MRRHTLGEIRRSLEILKGAQVFDKSNWTRCRKPQKGDEVLNKDGALVAVVVRVRKSDGALIVKLDPSYHLAPYLPRPFAICHGERWEDLLEQGILKLRRRT